MSAQAPGYELQQSADNGLILALTGDWVQGQQSAEFAPLRGEISHATVNRLVVNGASLGNWDALLMAFLLQCHDHCRITPAVQQDLSRSQS